MNTFVNNKPTIAQNVWFSENKLIVQMEEKFQFLWNGIRSLEMLLMRS